MRVVGYQEFRKAFGKFIARSCTLLDTPVMASFNVHVLTVIALLNGGFFGGRCLVADGRNEKEKISIRTLIHVGRPKGPPRVRQVAAQSGQSLVPFPSPVSSSFPSPVDIRPVSN